ncbi:hypothetical protein B566_EDAN016088 [Ephemera danica]|nr:hypothetical protein B566_EDAN016088 [Ephemera danica]
MRAILLLCLLGAILGANGVRIGGPTFGIYPSEPRLEFYNPLTPGVPPPVMEDSEPENRLLQQPPGPKVPGLQIENVVQALRYRYPDPTTTPRPFSAAALYGTIHPDAPTAYAQRRPDPIPTPPPTRVQQVLVSPDGTLITGNQIDLTEYQSPQQQAQAQAIQQQGQIIQQQRQSQLASQQLQQAQQRLQQRLLMRQRLRQMILQQQQDDALRQQQAQQLGQPQFTSADLSQVQPAFQAVQQDLNQQFQQPAQADFHQTFQPAIESLFEHPIEQQPAVLPLEQLPSATSGVSYSRTYHVSHVTDHQK